MSGLVSFVKVRPVVLLSTPAVICKPSSPIAHHVRTLTRRYAGTNRRPSTEDKNTLLANKQTYRYASSSSSSYHDAYRGTMRVIWAVIGLNAVTFLAWNDPTDAQNGHQRRRLLSDHMTLSWRNIRAGRYYTAITSAFSHYNATHLFFNMFGLWTFGSIVARSGVGPLATISLLTGSALTGSIAWLYEHHEDETSSRRSLFEMPRTAAINSALGASGMLMGAVATATCLAPMAPMALLGVIPMPLYVATAGFVAMDLYYLDKASKIGHSAHLGGAVFGAVYYFAFLPRLGGISRMLARRRF